MKRFLSQKSKLAIKQIQMRLSQRCLENEKHFRLHLLWNIAQKSTQPFYDPQFFNILLRQYPCDCIQHRIKPNTIDNNMLHENIVASELHDFCETNQLFSERKRSDLLNLYNFISSSFFTFQEKCEKYQIDLNDYIEWCRLVSMKNFALHEQLTKEAIDYNQIKIHHLPPRPIPRELLRTQTIIDEQISIGMERQRKVVSRCILPSTRKIADKETPKLKPHIVKSVNSHVPDSSTRCISSDQMKLERAILIEQAVDLDNSEIVDINTLNHDLEEVETKYRKLLEHKNTLLGEIAKRKRDFVSLSKIGITKTEELNYNNTRLEIYRDIISKNTAELTKILDENKYIQNKLDLLATTRRSLQFSARYKQAL
ncbi:hypothetical protein TRFO_17156 [Tritrichomonas foetus]|uniref:Uncharacterized protein n=1 Tax=Tritrichomonas foetus TaxID=1144522 RepID=A0A1J4KTS6_9EUKA|nr:hypothetical protein TRFO_17156 [Tritrichomonas foetus]|eukprot:OHT12885.1 hypothetical protein TRFO_17156 [Tritrichomonas foetus]